MMHERSSRLGGQRRILGTQPRATTRHREQGSTFRAQSPRLTNFSSCHFDLGGIETWLGVVPIEQTDSTQPYEPVTLRGSADS